MAGIYSKPVGRPAAIEKKSFNKQILRFKNRIVKDGRIVGKHNDVWSDISESLDRKLQPGSIYSMCLQKSVKDVLIPCEESSVSTNESNDDDIIQKRLSDSPTSGNEGLTFEISFSRAEFESLVIEKEKRVSKRNRQKNAKRTYRCFRPGIWQSFMQEIITRSSNLKCGFNFEEHSINLLENKGVFKASCRCKSTLQCEFKEDFKSKIIIGKCYYEKGEDKKECGKRYLRGPARDAICQILEHKSVDRYRAEEAAKYMLPDGREPPTLPSANVLNVAKSQRKEATYLDKHPIIALVKMKYGTHTNCIQDIGHDPFYVRYTTFEQLQTFRRVCTKEDKIRVSIDSTGSLVRKLKNEMNVESKHVFMHAMAMHSSAGQFLATQMLADRSQQATYYLWLQSFHRDGAPIPDEVTADDSRALLLGAIKFYTNFNTIEDYANALESENLQKTLIRIDIAHFIKKYARYFSSLPKTKKTTYLACIGLLTQCTNIAEAARIVKSLFLISGSDFEGNLNDNVQSECKKAIDFLLSRITGEEDSYNPYAEIEFTIADDDCQDDVSTPGENYWETWSQQLYSDILPHLHKGNRINGYRIDENLNFKTYLLKDLALFPMWSNLYCEKYGFEPQSATSAPIEGEFKRIKYFVFLKGELPLRVDDFVNQHICYLQGKSRLVNAAALEQEKQNASCQTDEDKISDNNESVISSTQRPSQNKSKGNPQSQNRQMQCPACIKGDEPTGAHKCIRCGKHVHPFDECSQSIGDEEGYGESRLCFNCAQGDNEEDVDIQNASFQNKVEAIPPIDISIKQKRAPENSQYYEALNVKNKNLNKTLPKIKSIETVKPPSQLYLQEKNYGKNELNVNQVHEDIQSIKEICQNGSIQNNSSKENEQTQYSTCSNKSELSDKHQCSVCNQRIHFLDCCSQRIGDANSGQERICLSCVKIPNLQNQLVYDNWKNQGAINAKIERTRKTAESPNTTASKKRKPALYLTLSKSVIKDKISIERHASIPLIKHGSSTDLKSVKIDENYVIVGNTCAFDSLAQLILTGAYDFEIIDQLVARTENCSFMECIQHIKKHGITQHAYVLRARILKETFGWLESRNSPSMKLIDSFCNVGGATNRYLKGHTSFEEISTCGKGCSPRKKFLVTHILDKCALASNSDDNLIEKFVNIIRNIPCANSNCNGRETTSIHVGDMVIWNIDLDTGERKVELRDLRQTIPYHSSTKVLKLLGIVDFVNRNHYTAIAYRRGDRRWCLFDGLRQKMVYVSDKTLVLPALAIYVKVKK